jgi:ABC-type thiamine transport system substrate-binding protein
MYPAKAAGSLPEGFGGLHRPTVSLLMSAEAAQAARGPAVETWSRALSR